MFLGVVCLLAATALRAAFDLISTDLAFVTYFPALLVTGLLAGVPTAIAMAVLSVLVVWTGIVGPRSPFAPLDSGFAFTVGMWAISASLIILFAHWCRLVLKRLRMREVEREITVRELEHRGRNTYAVIQAIVQNTLEGDRERADNILGRIRAVKYANDLISHTHSHAAPLDTLLQHAFAPYGEARLSATGPPIDIEAQNARHLVLIFHELATNAAKHGALSQPAGRVHVTWDVNGPDVVLRWREQGGPPVQAPSRAGFGSKLIAQCSRAVSGAIEPEFSPDGFACTLRFHLGE
ncbi:MAG: sensor histidine kinase [Pseudolabrys sp.]